jgi:hypothetical protein
MISFAAPAEQSDRETCEQRLPIIAEDTRITARARNREHPKWCSRFSQLLRDAGHAQPTITQQDRLRFLINVRCRPVPCSRRQIASSVSRWAARGGVDDARRRWIRPKSAHGETVLV